MWVDPKKYKHYALLEELKDALQSEYAQWKTRHDIYKDALCVYGYEYEDNSVQMKIPDNFLKENLINAEEVKHAKDWWAICLYFSRRSMGEEFFPGEWTESTNIIKRMPGVCQTIINFVVPNGKLPYHTDVGGWEKIESDHGKPIKGYSAVIAIDTPTPNTFSFLETPERKTFESGSIYAFEGRYHSHEIVNETNQWRATCVIEIAAEEWENVDT